MRAVLMLHAVDTTGSVLSVSAAQLRGLIRAIHDSGHDIVSLGRLLSEPRRENQVALTFDDGFESVAESAAPILRDAGVQATLFLTTGFVGRDNRWPSQPKAAPTFPMMRWEQVESLHRGGWEIEAHTRTHPDLRLASEEELECELEDPKAEIERRLGRRPQTFAYPYGYLNERVVAAARRHYRYAATTSMATLDGVQIDSHRIPRIDAYYIRSPSIHRWFGQPCFRAFTELRAFLRRARGHPGEGS